MKTLDLIKEARRAHLFKLRSNLDAAQSRFASALDEADEAEHAVTVAAHSFPVELEDELQALEAEKRS